MDSATQVKPISIVPHQAPRFSVEDAEGASAMLDYLDKHGYAVIAGVSSPKLTEQAKDDFWAFTSETTPSVRRDDPSTWQGKDWVADDATGIHNRLGLNHNKFCWNARLLPGVKKTFAKIWGTSELIVSYDAGNVFRPWKYNPAWATKSNWWHLDQNATKPNRKGRVTVQGLVTYYDADESTGGLCVVPGSHLHIEEVCGRVKYVQYSGDYVPVKVGDPIFELNQPILVCAKAGDLVLWDSRTVHCNTPSPLAPPASKVEAESDAAQTAFVGPALDENGQPWELLRLCAYVCMVPRSHADAKMLESRKGAFINRVGTSHYPAAYMQHGWPIKNGVDPTQCSRAMLELVGYQANYYDAMFNPALAKVLRSEGTASGEEGAEKGESSGSSDCIVM